MSTGDPLRAALVTVAVGVAVFLLRRRIARLKAARSDRTYDEDALAWWYGAMGVLIGTVGVAFLVIALR